MEAGRAGQLLRSADPCRQSEQDETIELGLLNTDDRTTDRKRVPPPHKFHEFETLLEYARNDGIFPSL